MSDLSPEYREAVRRLMARRRLFLHARWFLAANAVSVGCNWLFWRGYAWCLWPAAVWGVGLFFQAVFTFAPMRDRLHEPRIQEILATLRHGPLLRRK